MNDEFPPRKSFGAFPPEPDVVVGFKNGLASAGRARRRLRGRLPGSDFSHPIAHFELTERIKSTGTTAVYRAIDTQLNRAVVLKVFRSGDNGQQPGPATREARLAASVSHPNIVAIHQIIHGKGWDVLVMENVPGHTLEELILPQGLSGAAALNLAGQLAAALRKLASVGIVHRDLKPLNILVTRDGELKLIDFGLAISGVEDDEDHEDRKRNTKDAIIGTAAYMSPEQVRCLPVDWRSDLYSLGAIFFQMLTGRKTFKKPSLPETFAAVLTEDPLASVPALDSRITTILRGCLAKSPSDRFQTADQLIEALTSASNAIAQTAPMSLRRK